MNTYGHDLERIARQDKRTLEETTRAFEEAVKIASKQEEPIPETLARILESRRTLRVHLGAATRLYDHNPAMPEPKLDKLRPCRHVGCARPTMPTSYYWCGEHVPVREESDEEFLMRGASGGNAYRPTLTKRQ